MATKHKRPFGGNRHKGQFGKGGKRAPAPTHDISPTEQFGDDNASAMSPGGASPLTGTPRAPAPPPDFDNDGM